MPPKRRRNSNHFEPLIQLPFRIKAVYAILSLAVGFVGACIVAPFLLEKLAAATAVFGLMLGPIEPQKAILILGLTSIFFSWPVYQIITAHARRQISRYS